MPHETAPFPTVTLIELGFILGSILVASLWAIYKKPKEEPPVTHRARC